MNDEMGEMNAKTSATKSSEVAPTDSRTVE